MVRLLCPTCGRFLTEVSDLLGVVVRQPCPICKPRRVVTFERTLSGWEACVEAAALVRAAASHRRSLAEVSR